MSNRLADESSPYLLQHAENPVDWYPWSPEALERARVEDRPILLSIGYSACHWCHVMERESFEDAETARYMNEHFVPIKVDREERPDIDAIYMEAAQAMTGHGGWPLTAFLDPGGVPFYAGTYFPPEPRHGMPSFRMVMEAVVASFTERRDELRQASERIRGQLGATARMRAADEEIRADALPEAISELRRQFDPRNGGFGGAPKFPPASALELLLTRGEVDIVELTLDRMAAGGIYDQLGGGFARYSVDAHWLVPHFEKMLYDNALLARTYLHGWQELGHERWRRVCEETLEWMLREMRGPEGGFYSALDADSEGEEGRFYVWGREELERSLAAAGMTPPEAGAIAAHLGVSEGGNFEGANVLHLAPGAAAEAPPRFDEARAALFAERAKRVRPGLDDKRIAAWNGLAIGAFAEAGAVLGRAEFLAAAVGAATFVEERMRDAEGRLLRTWKDRPGPSRAFLEDHAYLVEAFLTLYEGTLDARWFDAARRTADQMIEFFHDDEHGGFFTTPSDGEELIVRRKDVEDHPIPSGNSAAAFGLLRLAALTGEHVYEEKALGVMRLFHPAARRHPQALAHTLRALDFHLAAVREVALIAPADAEVAPALEPFTSVVRARFRPRLVLAGGPEGSDRPALLADRPALDGSPAAYVCERFACQAPTGDPAALERALSASVPAR